MNVSIEKARSIREELGATHLIMFVAGVDGQNVATHGLNEQHAHEAADFGNKLKQLLKWPDELCQSTPQQRAEWNRKTVSQIQAQIEKLQKEGQECFERIDRLGLDPSNLDELYKLNNKFVQNHFAVEQLQWVLAQDAQ